MKLSDATKEELQEYFLGPKSRRIGYTTEERDQRFLAWLCRKRSRALFDELDKVAEEQKGVTVAYLKKYKEFTAENDPAEKLKLCHETIDIGIKLERLQGRWEAINKKLEELDQQEE